MATKSNGLLGFVPKGLKILNIGFVLIDPLSLDATLFGYLILDTSIRRTYENCDL